MAKKEILFLMNNLPVGGIAKALLALLNEIDYQKYNIDLALFEHTGLFMQSIPDNVNLLKPLFIKDNIEVKPFSNIIKNFQKSFSSGCRWIKYFVKYSFIRVFCGKEKFYYWYCKDQIKNTINIDKEYDAVVAFASQHNIYFAIDKVKAKTKIGFIHNDYSKSDYKYYLLDKEYFNKLDYLATISNECVNVLKDYFPEMKDKIICIPNLVSCQFIEKSAKEFIVPEMVDDKYQYVVTTCRISIYDKGLDYVVECAKRFKQEKYNIKWIIVGGGGEEEQLRELIRANDVADYVIITGVQINPYPYVSQCDLFVQPSRFEGKSISVDEAKLLCKPIILTNYSTAYDQISNGVNGIICDMNVQSISDTIIDLIGDEDKQHRLVEELVREKKDNTAEVLSIYEKLWR